MFKIHQFRFKYQKNQVGFTLIELLVVISIIGVLSALMITNLVGARTRAADSKKKAELNQLVSSLRLYYNDYQNYPPGTGLINTGSFLQPGDAFEYGGTTYMKALPADYRYYSSSPYDSFILRAQLGNLSDEQLQDNFAKCCNPTRTGCPATLTNEFILCED